MSLNLSIILILSLIPGFLLKFTGPVWGAFLIFCTGVAGYLFLLSREPEFHSAKEKARPEANQFLYFMLALLVLFAVFPTEPLIISSAWVFAATGMGAAGLAGKFSQEEKVPWNPEQRIIETVFFGVFGTLILLVLLEWRQFSSSLIAILGVAFLMGLAGTLLYSLPIRFPKLILYPLVCGFLLRVLLPVPDYMPIFFSEELTGYRWWAGFTLSTGGALMALALRQLTLCGAVVAALMGVLIFLFEPWGWLLLAFFFTIGSSAALIRKERGIRFQKIKSIGGRNAFQVFGKGAVPIFFAFLAACSDLPDLYRVALVGAIATALADTVESEVGRLSGIKPRRSGSLEQVEVGHPGAVSRVGSLAGIIASTGTALFALQLGLLSEWNWPLIPVAAFLGTWLESRLQDQLPEHTPLSGPAFNLASTFAGATAALLLAVLFGQNT